MIVIRLNPGAPTELVPRSVPDTFRPDPMLAQIEGWRGEQGLSYAHRNPQTVEATDESYQKRFGITRTELSRRYLVNVPRTAKVLEVGTAAGAQLKVLAGLGFKSLEGCDVCSEALELCPYPHQTASILSLPYADASFDLVFTSGTLMHVTPFQRDRAIAELLRVSRRWVWGFELYTKNLTMATFGDLIPPAWGEAWPERWTKNHPGLKLHGRTIHKTKGGAMVYAMYLLEKEQP